MVANAALRRSGAERTSGRIRPLDAGGLSQRDNPYQPALDTANALCNNTRIHEKSGVAGARGIVLVQFSGSRR